MFPCLRKDGSIIYTEISTAPLMIGKKIMCVVGLFRDVTERIKAVNELKKLSLAVEQSPVSVVITDRTGKIEYVNPRFTEVTGYSAEEAFNQNPRILKSGEKPPEFYKKHVGNHFFRERIGAGNFATKRKTGTFTGNKLPFHRSAMKKAMLRTLSQLKKILQNGSAQKSKFAV